MKFSGITRKIDKLGRIVIPADLREHLGWKHDTAVEIHLFGNYVLLNAENERPSQQIKLENARPITDAILLSIPRISDNDALFVLEMIQRLANHE